jgi:hypothetical protein
MSQCIIYGQQLRCLMKPLCRVAVVLQRMGRVGCSGCYSPLMITNNTNRGSRAAINENRAGRQVHGRRWGKVLLRYLASMRNTAVFVGD